MTPMQKLLNQLRDERSNLLMPIEWDRCYQAIEMVIENTYLPMEQEISKDAKNASFDEISDEEIEKAAWKYVYDNKMDATNIVHYVRACKWYREKLKK